MPRRSDDHVRREHDAIADVYIRIVHESNAEITVNIFTEMHVTAAEIAVQGRFEIATLPHFGEHFFHQLLS